MAVWYLDDEDEITEAVARLRGATEEQVVFVVPPGSRIATGRINFKLLGREATARGLRLAIASPDAQVRAMASSAGVLGLATAADAEAALRRGDVPPEPVEAGEGAEASGEPTAAVVEVGTDATAGRSRWTGRRVAAGVALVLIVAGVGVVASLQTLPTAEVTLTPRTASIGPLPLTITALTTVSEPDPETGRLPAVDVSIPLSAEQTYPATGREIAEARATGVIVLTSQDQPFDQPILVGTRVQTPSGVEFRTTEPVIMPRVAAGGPSQVMVDVEAVVPGREGNVPAGADQPGALARGAGHQGQQSRSHQRRPPRGDARRHAG